MTQRLYAKTGGPPDDWEKLIVKVKRKGKWEHLKDVLEVDVLSCWARVALTEGDEIVLKDEAFIPHKIYGNFRIEER